MSYKAVNDQDKWDMFNKWCARPFLAQSTAVVYADLSPRASAFHPVMYLASRPEWWAGTYKVSEDLCLFIAREWKSLQPSLGDKVAVINFSMEPVSERMVEIGLERGGNAFGIQDAPHSCVWTWPPDVRLTCLNSSVFFFFALCFALLNVQMVHVGAHDDG